jgi:hypothetical protein
LKILLTLRAKSHNRRNFFAHPEQWKRSERYETRRAEMGNEVGA